MRGNRRNWRIGGVIGAKDDNVRRRVKTEKIRRAKGDRKEKFGIVLDNCLRVTMFFTTGLKVWDSGPFPSFNVTRKCMPLPLTDVVNSGWMCFQPEHTEMSVSGIWIMVQQYISSQGLRLKTSSLLPKNWVLKSPGMPAIEDLFLFYSTIFIWSDKRTSYNWLLTILINMLYQCLIITD